MGALSYSLRIEYHEFVVQSIAAYHDFKPHYKELIAENVTDLITVMDKILTSKPVIQEKKSNVREIDVEKTEIIQKSSKLLNDILSLIQINNLESYKSIITKSFKKSSIRSFKKAFEFVANLNNTISNYPSLAEYKEKTKDLYDKIVSVSSEEGSEKSTKKMSINDINELNKEWDCIYSVLKCLIEAHFGKDKEKYKSFFKDLI